MTTTAQAALGAALVLAAVGLAVLGEHLAPPVQGPVGRDARKKGCSIEAPQPLTEAAKRWCASGLFVRAAARADDKNVIAVMQFTPNGAQTWELQSGLLIGEFRNLTDQMAADAGGREIGVDLHDAADRRVGACARTRADAAATCTTR